MFTIEQINARTSAAMFSAVSKKLIVRLNNLLSRDSALGLHRHEFRMIFPDQLQEFVREGGKPADQIPIAGFEAFSFGAISKSKVHWGSPVQEEPAGLSGLDGSWASD